MHKLILGTPGGGWNWRCKYRNCLHSECNRVIRNIEIKVSHAKCIEND